MRKLLLAVLPLVFVVLATELFLRATHAFNARLAWTEPDPEIGYRFTPRRSYWFFAENDHPVEGTINSAGWRDRERSRARPEGSFRVAVVGDSFVEAFQVELDSTFVAVAERLLNESHPASGSPRFECLNFGRSGMTTTEERVVVERDVLPYDPDAVVLLFTSNNDIRDVNPATASHGLRPFPRVETDGSIGIDIGFAASAAYRTRARVNGVKQRSALGSLLAERYNVLRRAPRTEGAEPEVERITRDLSLCTATPDSTFAVNYAMNKMLIADIARMCRERGARFLIMSVPVVTGDEALRRLRDLDPSFAPDFFERDLAAHADTIGAEFVPLAGDFLRGGKDLWWWHWNYAGHRVAGAALAAALAADPPAPARAID